MGGGGIIIPTQTRIAKTQPMLRCFVVIRVIIKVFSWHLKREYGLTHFKYAKRIQIPR